MIDEFIYLLLPLGLLLNFLTIWIMNNKVYKIDGQHGGGGANSDAVHFNVFSLVHCLALVVASVQHWMMRTFTPAVQYVDACYLFAYLKALALTLAMTIDLVGQLHLFKQMRRVQRRSAEGSFYSKLYLGLFFSALALHSARWFELTNEDVFYDKEVDQELKRSPLYADCRHYGRVSLIVFDLIDLTVLIFSSLTRTILAFSTILVVSKLTKSHSGKAKPLRFAFLYTLCTIISPVLNGPITLVRMGRHSASEQEAYQSDSNSFETFCILLQHLYLVSPFLTQAIVNVKFKRYIVERLGRKKLAKKDSTTLAVSVS